MISLPKQGKRNKKRPGNRIYFRDEQIIFTRGATRIDAKGHPLKDMKLKIQRMERSRTYYSSEARFQPVTRYLFQTFHKSRISIAILTDDLLYVNW